MSKPEARKHSGGFMLKELNYK